MNHPSGMMFAMKHSLGLFSRDDADVRYKRPSGTMFITGTSIGDDVYHGNFVPTVKSGNSEK